MKDQLIKLHQSIGATINLYDKHEETCRRQGNTVEADKYKVMGHELAKVGVAIGMIILDHIE